MAYVRIEQSSHDVHQGTELFGEKTFIPNLSIHGFSSEPSTYIWTLGTAYSNYTESNEEWSKFSVSVVSGGLNQKHIGIRVKDIRDGEAVFVPISVTVSNGGESASYSCKTVVVMGKPRTTPLTITGIKNGRLVYTKIYQDAIERRIKNAEIKNNKYANVNSDTTTSIQDLQLNIDDFTKRGKKMFGYDLNSSPDRLYQLENEAFNLKYTDRKALAQGAMLGIKPLLKGEIQIPMYYHGRSSHTTIFNNPDERPHVEDPAFIMPYPEPDPCSHDTITTSCDSYNCEENECGDTECTTTTTTTTQSIYDYCNDILGEHNGPLSQAELLEILESRNAKPDPNPNKARKLNCIASDIKALDAKLLKLRKHFEDMEEKRKNIKTRLDEICTKPDKKVNKSYRVDTTINPRHISLAIGSCKATTTLEIEEVVEHGRASRTLGDYHILPGIDVQAVVDEANNAPFDSYPYSQTPSTQYDYDTLNEAVECFSDRGRALAFQGKLQTNHRFYQLRVIGDTSCWTINDMATRAVNITHVDGSTTNFTSGAEAKQWLIDHNVDLDGAHPVPAETTIANEYNTVYSTPAITFKADNGLLIRLRANWCQGTSHKTVQKGGDLNIEAKVSTGSNGKNVVNTRQHRAKRISSNAKEGRQPTSSDAGQTQVTVPQVNNNTPTLSEALDADPINSVAIAATPKPNVTQMVGNDNVSTNSQQGAGMYGSWEYEPPSYTQNGFDFATIELEAGREWRYRGHNWGSVIFGEFLANDCDELGMQYGEIMRYGGRLTLDFTPSAGLALEIFHNPLRDETGATGGATWTF